MNGIAIFNKNTNKSGITGSIKFHQCCPDHGTVITVNLSGFAPNAIHAFHIHEYGDFTNGCESAGEHYNPFGKNHGSLIIDHAIIEFPELLIKVIKSLRAELSAPELLTKELEDYNGRHVGDMINNLNADDNGNVNLIFEDDLISLYPPHSIYGRSIMIHENPDDLGLGGTKDSITKGSAGKRIACAIIGVSA